MVRAVVLAIAVLLTGAPGVLACAASCEAMSAQSDGQCRHERPLAASNVVAAWNCDSPAAGIPYLAETIYRAPDASVARLFTGATVPEPHAQDRPGYVPAFPGSPPDRVLRLSALPPVLRI